MKTLIGFEEIEDKIITLRGQKVLLDRDVAYFVWGGNTGY